jgi:hypothetical protein
MNTILAIFFIAFSLLTGASRGKFIEGVVSAYEKQAGEIVVIDCPFVDTDISSAACKAHEVGIVVGTSATTFNPDDRLQPYQAFLIVGKTMMLLDK